jgi:hypothetical protein
MAGKIPNCEHCGTPLVKHAQKNYWVCPNWLPNQQGCPGMIYYPEGDRKKNYPDVAFSYKVPSKSIPGLMRQVKIYESGDVECSCPAEMRGIFCRHKIIMVSDVGTLLTKIIKRNFQAYERLDRAKKGGNGKKK